MTEVIIIVAVAQNNIIGRDNDIPWRIREDFLHFKKHTTGHPCIMSDVCYKSLPEKSRPLPNRENIVLTFDETYKPEGTTVFNDFHKAIEYCKANNEEKVFITGGSSIYKLGLEIADTFLLTRLHKDIEGDVSFPDVDWTQWKEVSSEKNTSLESISKTDINYSFIEYKRVN
jgi:dihydrofolate reductase